VNKTILGHGEQLLCPSPVDCNRNRSLVWDGTARTKLLYHLDFPNLKTIPQEDS
jgi:hypothetical protein